MALATYALLDYDEASTYLGLRDDNERSFVESLVNAASLQCERQAGRKLKSRTFTAEVYDGSGEMYQRLRNGDVTAVTAVQFKASPTTWDTTLNLTDNPVTIDSDGERIWLFTYGFACGVQNVRVTYTAGLTSIEDDLKTACKKALAWEYREKDRSKEGILSVSAFGQTTVYRSSPPDLRGDLGRYLRVAA